MIYRHILWTPTPKVMLKFIRKKGSREENVGEAMF